MEDNNLNNMTNTNEVENNVMINNQGNNLEQNNAKINYNKKNNNSNFPVIIMFIVLILFVFVFLGNDNNLFSSNNNNKQEQNNGLIDNNEKEENNKDNVQEENKDNSNVDNNQKDYAKLEQKVLDEYYLKTTDIINEHILKYKYSAIENNEISYSDFRKKYTIKNIIDSLKIVKNDKCVDSSLIDNTNDKYDKNCVKYPKYCTKSEYGGYGCVEELAQAYGLTVDEISKMDKNVWYIPSAMDFEFIMYDASEIDEKYLDIYNDIFTSSFKIYLENKIFGTLGGYIYDKNIEKIIIPPVGGIGGEEFVRLIIDSKEEGNLYKVRFVEGTFSQGEGDKWIESSINEEISKNDENEARELIKRNKDKLPNYEITFEKTSTGYKYKSIRKIENKIEVENSNNKEINLKSIECMQEDNKCTKVFNVNYNGMKHEIKIVQSIEGENVGVPYSYNKSIKIYIDGNIIDTIENISSGTNNSDFDGYAYIFDSKYLGIIYPSNQGDYVLNVYNNNSKIGEQKIIWGLQGIYKDKEYKEQLNTLEKIEFNGNKLLFWGDSCYVPLNVGDKFIKISLTIKNNKINMESVDLLDKLYGSGATC